MLSLIQKHWRFFLLAALAGVALRLLFVLRFPVLEGDTLVYAQIARNWLNTGIFGLTSNGQVSPTLIRLPGYPAFLAAIFAIFGHDAFRAVMLVQLVFDIATCLLVADITRRILPGSRAPRIAFLIAALCPFTANYVGTPLTETLSIFFITAALDLAIAADDSQRWREWVLCGLATACAILLRPDGGLLLGAIGLWLLYFIFRPTPNRPALRTFTAACLLAVVSLAPLIPWAIRNWRTFHVFQPLVTFEATDPGEFTPKGWNRWLKTWMIDYVTVENIGFHVSGETIEMRFVPPRAFDSEEQRQRVAQLFDAYNAITDMTPELDAQFAEIARERIHAHPVRYYVLLPLARLTALWLRPRTEMLPIDSFWWHFKEDPHDSSIAIALGLLNLALIIAAVIGAIEVLRTTRAGRYAALLLLFVAIRSIFMMLAGVAEERYMLECYPVVFVFAAFAMSRDTRMP